MSPIKSCVGNVAIMPAMPVKPQHQGADKNHGFGAVADVDEATRTGFDSFSRNEYGGCRLF